MENLGEYLVFYKYNVFIIKQADMLLRTFLSKYEINFNFIDV